MSSALGQLFTVTIGDFYRPLALLPLLLTGDTLAYAQLAKLAMMLVFFALIYRTARELGISRLAALLVASITITHQLFASVVTEIDLWADLACSVAFVLQIYWGARHSLGKITRQYYWIASAINAIVCLLFKEAGVGLVLVPAAFALITPFPTTRHQRLGHIACTLFTVAIVAAYLVHRLTLPVAVVGNQSGYYSMTVGANLIRNLVFAVGGLVCPVNTVHVALDSTVWRVAAIAWIIGIVVLILLGLISNFRHRTARLPFLLFGLAIAAQGPVLLMPHLTEANMTRSLAIGWLAIASSIQPLMRKDLARVFIPVIMILVVLWFAFDLPAVYYKSTDIIVRQQRADRFRENVKTALPVPPPQTITFALLDPGYRGYSRYRIPLLMQVAYGEVPTSLQDMYAPHPFNSRSIVVQSAAEADSLRADYLVMDSGEIRRLKSDWVPADAH
jgi:hypothetical protein